MLVVTLLATSAAVAWSQEFDASVAADVDASAAAQPAAAAPAPARGLASWYGLTFHGRRTASGERFDMNALTAAHPWLPFGTLVQVRSLVNDRVVTVRINDRGPHTGGRIIDLSHAAARALGLLSRGTKPVELRPLNAPPPR